MNTDGLLFAQANEIGRLRAELVDCRAAWLVEINKVARVRELCASLRALDGDTE